MKTGIWTAVVSVCLCAATTSAQTPNLTRQQRDLLHAVVSAVDAAGAQPPLDDAHWRAHVMRASDGSHYVAFTLSPPPDVALPAGPALLYLRVATATPPGATKITERSAIREWLAGGRTDPRLLPKRGIAIGEMPVMGATGSMGRQAMSTGVNEMRLMALERERAKQKQEELDKQRRAELEGKLAVTRDSLPFEDFDLASHSVREDGARIITRAFTAGPGDYDVFIGWADLANPKPASTVRVIRKSLSLAPAAAEGLTTSSIILADRVAVRTAPYPPTEQASHPYSIGLMEITPATDATYTRDDALSIAFQVINARGSDAGMPDLTVGFRVVRVEGEREVPVASLKPQYYNAETMPSDFDLRQGHPIFAAVSAPLATLGRGAYRLKIAINDKIAGANAAAETSFRIVGTRASLLAEAPPVGRPFTRQQVTSPEALAPVIDALQPAAPSAALGRALAVARSGKLVDLLVEEPVAPAEAGIRTALTGLAYLSIGDASAPVHFARALQQNAPAAPVHYLIGAARAAQNRDPEAINAWTSALQAGQAPPLTRTLLVDALLRRGDHARATTVVSEANDQGASSDWPRLVAATHVAGGRFTEAIAVLDTYLSADAADADAQWLLLHALFGEVVRGGSKERFVAAADAYVERNGAHTELVREWLRIVSTS
jgi:tetratricopeptide (TPR) repeat protein